MMKVTQTRRLILRHINIDDAEFMLRLLNDPAFMQYIGDKQVRDMESAKNYILEGPVTSYRTYGYGLYLIELMEGNAPIGICGILRRDFLDHAELGYALMPDYCGCGYAVEAAKATLELARDDLQLSRLIAITASDNKRSIKLLEKIGMLFVEMTELASDGEEVKLYGCNL